MPNMKEIDLWEGCFGWLKFTFVKRCKEEEKVKKMGQFSGTHISQTTMPISFKFGMQGRVYREHKICELDRNWPCGYRDTRG